MEGRPRPCPNPTLIHLLLASEGSQPAYPVATLRDLKPPS